MADTGRVRAFFKRGGWFGDNRRHSEAAKKGWFGKRGAKVASVRARTLDSTEPNTGQVLDKKSLDPDQKQYMYRLQSWLKTYGQTTRAVSKHYGDLEAMGQSGQSGSKYAMAMQKKYRRDKLRVEKHLDDIDLHFCPEDTYVIYNTLRRKGYPEVREFEEKFQRPIPDRVQVREVGGEAEND